jgi:uncharacterized membrane protein
MSPSNPDPSKPPLPTETSTAQTGSKVNDPPKEHAPGIPVTEHMPETVAAPLCYLFGWVSGILFLLIDRRPFVRFHAAQSVAVFATLSILLLAVSGFFLGALFPHLEGVWFVIRRLLQLTWLVAVVVLMLKAAGGERVRVRYASQYGDRAAHSGR